MNSWHKEAGRTEIQSVGERADSRRKRDSFTRPHASSTYCVSGAPPNLGNAEENKKNTASALGELTASKRRPTASDDHRSVERWSENQGWVKTHRGSPDLVFVSGDGRIQGRLPGRSGVDS